MNKGSCQVIFDEPCGLWMAVMEFVRADGKGAGKRTFPAGLPTGLPAWMRPRPLCLGFLLAFGLASLPGRAQIVAYRAAPGSQRPTVLNAANGVPLVNIQTPSAAGVSRNTYSQFDVGEPGAILNNSRVNVQTRIGGWVQGNPWLATGSARVIVNEVRAANPSQLNGYVEVAGQRAEVIIANPAGISVRGGGFLNATSVTLAAGVPEWSADGALDSYRVEDGRIAVEGEGMDARDVDYTRLLARAAEINAGLWAQDLRLVAGANQVDAETFQAAPMGGAGEKPVFAVDVARLGGMYARQIHLIGTEAGVGVRNAGTLAASAGEVVVTIDGRLTHSGLTIGTDTRIDAAGIDNSGTLTGERHLAVNSRNDVDNTGLLHAGQEIRLEVGGRLSNSGSLEARRIELYADALNNSGALRQNGEQGMALLAARIDNAAGARIGKPVRAPDEGFGSEHDESREDGAAPAAEAVVPTTAAAGGIDLVPTAAVPVLPLADGLITVRGDLVNTGEIVASGSFALKSSEELENAGALILDRFDVAGNILRNSGEIHAVDAVVTAAVLDNSDGLFSVARHFAVRAREIANVRGSLLYSGADDFILRPNELDNRDGWIASNGPGFILSTATLDNTGGRIAHAGSSDFVLDAGVLGNSGGRIESLGAIRLTADTLDNSEGVVSAEKTLDADTGALDNRGGTLDADLSARVAAESIDNRDGQIVSGASLDVGTTGRLDNGRGILSGRTTATVMAGGELSNADGRIVAGTDLDVRASAVDNAGGILGAVEGRLDLTTPGAVDNHHGRIEAGTALTLESRGLDDTDGAVIGGTTLHIDTLGFTLDSTRGFLSAEDTLGIDSGELINVAGLIQAGGAIDIDTHDAALDNRDGGIVGQDALTLWVGDALNDAGGRIVAGTHLKLGANAVSNAGGLIGAAAGGLDLAAVNAVGNAGGRIEAFGALALEGRGFDNTAGAVLGQTIHLDTQGFALDNTRGLIRAEEALGVRSGPLDNTDGLIQAGGALSLDTQDGALINRDTGGADAPRGILGRQAVDLKLGALDNRDGLIGADGDIAIEAASGVDNAGGRILGGDAFVLTAGGDVANTNGVLSSGNSLHLTADGSLISTTGQIVAGANLQLNAKAVANAGGTLSAVEGRLDLAAEGGVDNRGGRIEAGDGLALSGAWLDNTGAGVVFGRTLDLVASGRIDNRGGLLVAEDTLSAEGGEIDNAGGHIGALMLTLDAAHLNNAGGLLRAGNLQVVATTIDNRNTLGANQGIEGDTVELTTGTLNNVRGALRASTLLDATLSGALLDNTGGLISSQGTLRVRDARALSGAAERSLVLVNTDGTLIADDFLAIDAARISGVGNLLSGEDLSLKLRSEIGVGANERIAANRNLSIETTRALTNDGRIEAGSALTLTAQSLANRATGTLTGRNLDVRVTGALTNRGLIDSGGTGSGEAHLAAAVLDNLGGGRIYGDHLALAAGTLNNLEENGTAPVIAARERLDLGIGALNNHGEALIFSAGDLAIGGALDSRRRATGRAKSIDNVSATIEALGNLAINTTILDNRKSVLEIERIQTNELPTGTALFDYVPDLKFFWGIEETSPITWRNFVRDRYIGIIANLLGGTLDATVRAELEALINAQPRSVYEDTRIVWKLLLDKIEADHPEYIAIMTQTFMEQGVPQQAFGQTCGGSDCDYISYLTTTQVTYRDMVTADSPAGVIRAGGNAVIDATHLSNQYSLIQSGGNMTLTGTTLTNLGAELYLVVDTTTVSHLVHWVDRDHGSHTTAHSTQTLIGGVPAIISAGGLLTGSFTERIDNLTIRENAGRVEGQDVRPGGANTVGNGGRSAAALSSEPADAEREARAAAADSLSRNDASLRRAAGELPDTGVSRIVQVSAADASGPAALVATAHLPLTLPANRLYHVSPRSTGPLVETDPDFASYRGWLSSDYMLSAYGLDPAVAQKRLGDGFYEQRLITEQISELTGRRFLEGYANDEEQYKALMNAGLTYAGEWQLVPGVALTAEQMARLTTDIVWLVEREVVLADGTVQRVLVPQVYVRVRDGDLDPQGALIAAGDIRLDTSGDLVSSGTITGREIVALTAENIELLRGRVTGSEVLAQANLDLEVLGGVIEAEHTLIATAGRDLTVESSTVDRSYRPSGGWTEASTEKTFIDRVAGLYVTGEDGTLVVAAERDLTLFAAGIINGGASTSTEASAATTLLSAGRDLHLGTIAETSDASTASKGNRWHEATSTDVGSVLFSDGALTLIAGNDLFARAAEVTAVGDLFASAGNDLTITTGEDHLESETWHKSKKGGSFSSRTRERLDTLDQTTAVLSLFSGDAVTLVAGKDLTIQGSQVVAQHDLIARAGNDLDIDVARESHAETHFMKSKQSGVFSSGSTGFTIGSRKQSSDQDTRTFSALGSFVGSLEGDVTLLAGGAYTQTGSVVFTPVGDITIAAQKIDIVAAEERYASDFTYRFQQSGLSVAVNVPVVQAVQTAVSSARTVGRSRNERIEALALANTAWDVYQAGQTLASVGENPQGAVQGISATISYGQQKSRSESHVRDAHALASRIEAGGTVRLLAAGGGEESNIRVVGSDVAGRAGTLLQAENQIQLLAAAQTHSERSSSQSSGWSVGAAIGSGQSGVMVGGNAGKGSGTGDGTTYRNTHVGDAQSVTTLISGGDTRIAGAQVIGRGVELEAQNLFIESLQDTDTYKGRQQNAGAQIVIGQGFSSISGSYGQTKVDADYAAVAEQSGIYAGEEGYRITVREHTDLKGALITSSQIAEDEGRNSFSTGTLTWSDIRNHADYSASGFSASGSWSSVAVDEKGKAGDEKGKAGDENDGKATSFASAVGLGHDSDHDGSTTYSGISTKNLTITDREKQQSLTGKSVEETIAAIYTDVSTENAAQAAGYLGNNFDRARVLDEINLQVQVTQEFRSNTLGAIAAYTESRQADLRKITGDPETSKAQKDEAFAEIYRLQYQRVFLEALVGVLAGSPDLAISKGTLQMAAIRMREESLKNSRLFEGVVDVNDPDGKVISNVSQKSGWFDGVALAGVRVDLDVICGENNGRCRTQEDDADNKILGEDGVPKLELDSQGRVQYEGDDEHPTLQSLLDDKAFSEKLYGATGGFQATQGGIYLGPLSFPYAVGSMLDLLHEGFAGSHDMIGGQAPGHYDEKGNTSRGRTPGENLAVDAWAVAAILPAAPFSISDLVSPDLLEMIFKVAQ